MEGKGPHTQSFELTGLSQYQFYLLEFILFHRSVQNTIVS